MTNSTIANRLFCLAIICILACFVEKSANAQSWAQKRLGQAARSVKTEAGRATKSVKRAVQGKKYQLRIANPARNGITFYVNDYPHFVGGNQEITVSVTSHQYPQIRFGYGMGYGYRSYNVGSGKYIFRWKLENAGVNGNRRLLNLYRR